MWIFFSSVPPRQKSPHCVAISSNLKHTAKGRKEAYGLRKIRKLRKLALPRKLRKFRKVVLPRKLRKFRKLSLQGSQEV